MSGMYGRFIRPHYKVIGKWFKYCVANKCPINEYACEYAAENGNLEMLKYLRKKKAPWDFRTASWAAAKGHLHIFEYLFERKYQCDMTNGRVRMLV